MSKMYLKANVKTEPLICGWYAWTHLIQPLALGSNLAYRYIPIMESFIESPELHQQALEMPEMIGSPFMDIHPDNVDLVKDLLSDTKETYSHLISLSNDYRKLTKLIDENAVGNSLQSLYESVPNSLKGLVEIVYNGVSKPYVRLIEPLLYKKYYSQQMYQIMLSEISTDYRPFLLNTPRLGSEDLILHDSISKSNLDDLYRAKSQPVSVDQLFEKFDLNGDSYNKFLALFTHEKSNVEKHKEFSGLRVRYFGHACVLLETRSVSILIDPIISYEYATKVNRFSYNDLPEFIDYILITHNHQDHIQIETLLQLRHKVGKIIVPKVNCGILFDPSLKLSLNYLGFNNVEEASEFNTIDVPGGEILPIPFFGEHGDLAIFSKLAYIVKLNEKTFLFAADSDNIEPKLYEHITSYFSDSIDVLFLGMECVGAPMSWVYAPLLDSQIPRKNDQSRTLSGSDYDKAVSLVKILDPSEVYIYAMGQEPWLSFIMGLAYTDNSPQIVHSDKLLTYCNQHSIKSQRLYLQYENIYE